MQEEKALIELMIIQSQISISPKEMKEGKNVLQLEQYLLNDDAIEDLHSLKNIKGDPIYDIRDSLLLAIKELKKFAA